jgi:hypothetical protein
MSHDRDRFAAASRWFFHTRDRSPTRELDPHGEIEPIDVERDVNVLWVQIRTGRIVKRPDFATGQDQATNGVLITRPSFEPISKVDRAEFVFRRFASTHYRPL